MASRFERHQLEWVWRNRSRRNRTARAGDEIGRFAREVQRRDVEPAIEVAEALAPIVDAQFRRHCRVAGAAGKVVTVHVEPASMVGVMKMRWHAALRAAMSARGRAWRGATIRFAPGRAGVAVRGV